MAMEYGHGYNKPTAKHPDVSCAVSNYGSCGGYTMFRFLTMDVCYLLYEAMKKIPIQAAQLISYGFYSNYNVYSNEFQLLVTNNIEERKHLLFLFLFNFSIISSSIAIGWPLLIDATSRLTFIIG